MHGGIANAVLPNEDFECAQAVAVRVAGTGRIERDASFSVGVRQYLVTRDVDDLSAAHVDLGAFRSLAS